SGRGEPPQAGAGERPRRLLRGLDLHRLRHLGGVWSGQRASKKPVVEGCLAIDTADLKRWNLLRPGITDRIGALTWRRGGEKKASSSVGDALTVGGRSG